MSEHTPNELNRNMSFKKILRDLHLQKHSTVLFAIEGPQLKLWALFTLPGFIKAI